MSKSIIIIGAGAAGLTAAISAARAGANVTILEAQERPGRKLLVTGNGRCNLTNHALASTQQIRSAFYEAGSQSLSERRESSRSSDGIFADQRRGGDSTASVHPEALFQEQPVYHGTGAALAHKLISAFDAKETISFFKSLGLLTIEKNECVYPYSMQASSVLEVLLAECRRLHVKVKFSQKILRIHENKACNTGSQKNEDLGNVQTQTRTAVESDFRFSVETPGWTYHADAIILACGSPAAPSTGASEACYQPAKTLGHTIIDPQPALVPLTCHSVFLNQLTGVRCRAEVTLVRLNKRHTAKGSETGGQKQRNKADTKIVAKDTGELQWTKYGVAGIVVFQLSRYLQNKISRIRNNPAGENTQQQTDRISSTPTSQYYELLINFLPDSTAEVLEQLLLERANDLAWESTSVLLRGILNEKLISPILEVAFTGSGYDPKVCAKLSRQDCVRICQTIMDFRLPVTGTKSFEMAQICAGGVDCREITDTLESCLQKGLYF
ncbi:MAG: FAD-dependent oxidoreductase, partial [Lachnospiraceae bacterium]|nr:FAD-dependent oxidoreductase [Lachnospiraceae bacterium]